MAKKIKDIGLGSKTKQPTRKEVFETAYPTFKGNDGLNTKKVNITKTAGEIPEVIPRQRFENRIKKNKNTKK